MRTGKCECRRMEIPQMGFLDRVSQRFFGESRRSGAKGQLSGFSELSQSGTAALGKGELCVVNMSGECGISCTQGAAWVTFPGRFCDYILTAGESLSLRGEGKIIVSGGAEGALIRVCNG